MKRSVLVIYSIPTPYRLSFFERLSQEDDIDLTVHYMSAGAANRIWRFDANASVRQSVLPGVTLNLRSADDVLPIWVNPTAPIRILRGRFDVVICTGWDSLTTFMARVACWVKRVPFVLWAGSTSHQSSWRRSLLALPVRRLVRSADALLVYGSASKAYLEQLGASGNRVFVSYNTVNVGLFRSMSLSLRAEQQSIRERLGIRNRLVVLFVGQLIHRKGVLDLFEAMRGLSPGLDVGLLWVGYGPLRRTLEDMSHAPGGVGQHFVTARTPEELATFYAAADVCVLPSHEEVWGLVVNEALASGLPVVVTDRVGAAPDLIEDGRNGFVVPAGDVEQLACTLRTLLTDDALRVRMAANAWDSIRHVNYEQNVDAFRQAIMSV